MEEPAAIGACEILSGVGEGWWPLVQEASDALDREVPGWEPIQIKEKFGLLRFYVKAGTADPSEETMRKMSLIVDSASFRSGQTCETCGEPGRRRTKMSWEQTLCDEHAEAHA
jgi:hypothetical protein